MAGASANRCAPSKLLPEGQLARGLRVHGVAPLRAVDDHMATAPSLSMRTAIALLGLSVAETAGLPGIARAPPPS